MPHGDFSDLAALVLIAGGLQQVFAPNFTDKGIGFFLPNFDEVTHEMAMLNKILGGFMFIVGCKLFTVRWNPKNGKLSGLACILCGSNIAHTTFYTLDSEVFVPRLFYGYAWILVMAGLHLIFRPNPEIKDVAAATAAAVDKKK